MNDDDIFAVECEIEYLGDNKFSELKVLKSITAKEYLEKYSESDHKSLCHKNKFTFFKLIFIFIIKNME